MLYYVTPLPPRYHQITLEEFLFGDKVSSLITNNETNTRTWMVGEIPDSLRWKVNPYYLRNALTAFCKRHKDLFEAERHSLYHSFRILKRSGGFRQIDAPMDELMAAQRELKDILERMFSAKTLYHTSAFAYVKGRCAVDAVRRHQKNESWWFAKLDFSNFFGSTTKKFVIDSLLHVYPFCQLSTVEGGEDALSEALDIAFLDGVLPQGTPLSPLITNMMMIPIDYALSNGLRDRNGQNFVYTRYADDLLISSRRDFKLREIEDYVTQILTDYDAPFHLKREKSRYGSRSGSNWNLGVVLNKDNHISIGYKNLRNFKSMLHNFLTDYRSGKMWELGDLQHALGLYSYYVMVDEETITNTVKTYAKKTGVDIIALMKKTVSEL